MYFFPINNHYYAQMASPLQLVLPSASQVAQTLSSEHSSSNLIAPEMLEETAYYLPDKLTWELTNVEMLTSLEVNYVISSTTVPTALSAQIHC